MASLTGKNLSMPRLRVVTAWWCSPFTQCHFALSTKTSRPNPVWFPIQGIAVHKLFPMLIHVCFLIHHNHFTIISKGKLHLYMSHPLWPDGISSCIIYVHLDCQVLCFSCFLMISSYFFFGMFTSTFYLKMFNTFHSVNVFLSLHLIKLL